MWPNDLKAAINRLLLLTTKLYLNLDDMISAVVT